jgi:P27 family predicted phage terminase small subunit
MGRRGPPKKPETEKRLAGTLRRDRATPSTPAVVVPLGAPERPEYLSRAARGAWDRLVPVLLERGLSPADWPSLEGLVNSYARAREAQADIDERGTLATTGQGLRLNPSVKVAEKAWAEVRAFSERFHLDPASRGRPTAPPTNKAGALERFTQAVQHMKGRGQ